MTKFDNKEFQFDGMYLTYGPYHRFVARFKRGGMVAFKKFLRENFTVEEYFAMIDRCGMPPLRALETKGYVQPHVAKTLKKYGYSATQAGLDQFLKDSRKHYFPSYPSQSV
jgi:hypothetical protein